MGRTSRASYADDQSQRREIQISRLDEDTAMTDEIAPNDVHTRTKREQGLIVVERWQDVQPYIEENRRRLKEFNPTRNGYVRPMRIVADIPNVVVEQWLKMGVNVFDRNDAKKVRQLLNSNEYKDFRVSPGKCKVN